MRPAGNPSPPRTSPSLRHPPRGTLVMNTGSLGRAGNTISPSPPAPLSSRSRAKGFPKSSPRGWVRAWHWDAPGWLQARCQSVRAEALMWADGLAQPPPLPGAACTGVEDEERGAAFVLLGEALKGLARAEVAEEGGQSFAARLTRGWRPAGQGRVKQMGMLPPWLLPTPPNTRCQAAEGELIVCRR